MSANIAELSQPSLVGRMIGKYTDKNAAANTSIRFLRDHAGETNFQMIRGLTKLVRHGADQVVEHKNEVLPDAVVRTVAMAAFTLGGLAESFAEIFGQHQLVRLSAGIRKTVLNMVSSEPYDWEWPYYGE